MWLKNCQKWQFLRSLWRHTEKWRHFHILKIIPKFFSPLFLGVYVSNFCQICHFRGLNRKNMHFRPLSLYICPYKGIFAKTSCSAPLPTTNMVQTKIFLKPRTHLQTKKIVAMLPPPKIFLPRKKYNRDVGGWDRLS